MVGYLIGCFVNPFTSTKCPHPERVDPKQDATVSFSVL